MLSSRANASLRWRAASVPVGLLLATTALAGCRSNPEPPPLDTSSKATSPSPSPTDTPPPMPAAARGTSEASAKAFVRHWVDVLNYAGPRGDDQAIRRLSSDGCDACSAIADFIAQVDASGGSIRGQGWTLLRVHIVSIARASAVVDARTLVHKQRVQMGPGATPRNFRGGIRLKTFWLSAQGTRWQVVRLDQPE